MTRISAHLLLALLAWALPASAAPSLVDTVRSRMQVLVVVAHPDDESGAAVFLWRMVHEWGGEVDQLVITNGEGGFRYSLFSESFYGLKLTDEAVGRAHLPAIRKRELKDAGAILGLREIVFLDQKDLRYGLDEREPLDSTWDTARVAKALDQQLSRRRYDVVLCLLPDSGTHAHHKAAAILALGASRRVQHRPLVLGYGSFRASDTATYRFRALERWPETRLVGPRPLLEVDRNQRTGFRDRLRYRTIASWEIAAHKSQGTMTDLMDNDVERFWPFVDPPQEALQRFETFLRSRP